MKGRGREGASWESMYALLAPPGSGRVRAKPGVGGRGRERGAEVERRGGRSTIKGRQLHH